ncbi:MAG TPA: class III extradiol ring-cleavage dioxygenase [Polyangiaceae bacterium]|jgi:4,5-DOPA dioxygenase extradiol|nr:class III extradiol ring-cleavage dioxygenase [Polyangiaceae bacterium]
MSPQSSGDGMGRRALLGGMASALTLLATSASAEEASSAPPVLFVSHGAPNLPLDEPRRSALSAWGKTLSRPSGIVVMTPHFGTRQLELGATGRGFNMYNMPGWFKKRLPQDLDYATPPSESLAQRVEALCGASERPIRAARRGFDHTTWMPLYYLYPGAPAPVLEVSFQYRPDRELFALGRALAPLRREGVVFVASGGMTHNLAHLTEEVATPPSWSREFDAWASEALEQRNVDALLDWRAKAPAAELAHPDDGGHFRVLLFALGAATAEGGIRKVLFPVSGFDSALSRRSVELR